MPREPAPRLLLVDDNVELRRLLRELLELRGGQVVGEAANGREALEVLEQVPCDAVILDLNMPVMDGRVTTAEIHRRYPHVEVIVFTVGGSTLVPDELFALGASAQFCKLDIDPLVEYVAGDAVRPQPRVPAGG